MMMMMMMMMTIDSPDPLCCLNRSSAINCGSHQGRESDVLWVSWGCKRSANI